MGAPVTDIKADTISSGPALYITGLNLFEISFSLAPFSAETIAGQSVFGPFHVIPAVSRAASEALR